MSAPQGPVWKGEKCFSAFAWEDARLPSHSLPFDTGSQAVKISLRRKRGPKKGTARELFVCKYYRTSGVKHTDIEGPKFLHREWTILSSVHHPNIVSYEDFSYDPNGAGLANLYLEYCSEGDLRLHLKEGSQDDRLKYHEGLQVLEQLAQALLYIHHGVSRNGSSTELASTISAGLQPAGEDDPTKWTTILHRDIKPENVFIAEHNANGIVVKLGDFGIARFETDGTDTYVGSADFMAPEQRAAIRHGTRRTTSRSDVYALGVTIERVTKPDASPKDEPSQPQSSHNQQIGWSDLLSHLTHEDDRERPESGAIIDMIQASFNDSQSSATMLGAAVRDILEFSTSGLNANNKRKAKTNLASRVLLCRRLLLAGVGAGGSPPERTSLMWLAVAFLNASLESLEMSDGSGVQCPGWKGDFVEALISILRQHGAIDPTLSSSADDAAIPYDLGQYTYHSLQRSSKPDRRKALFDVIMSRFGGYLSPNTELSVLENSTWAELLPFTSSDHRRAAASLDAKRAEWHELQSQEQYLDVVVSSSKPVYPASPDDKSRGSSRVRRESAMAPLGSKGGAGSYVPPPRRPITSQPTMSGAPFDPAIISFSKPVPTPKKTTDDHMRGTAEAFKQFADNEKLRIRAAQEAKLTNHLHDRTAKLNDLKKFGANFKLKTRIPDDLVPVLTKDKEKQSEIKRKAEESARLDEEKRKDHDKEGTEPKPTKSAPSQATTPSEARTHTNRVSQNLRGGIQMSSPRAPLQQRQNLPFMNQARGGVPPPQPLPTDLRIPTAPKGTQGM